MLKERRRNLKYIPRTFGKILGIFQRIFFVENPQNEGKILNF